MRFFIKACLCLITVITFSYIHSQTPINGDSELDQSIKKRLDIGLHPSIAIAVIDSSGTAYFNFGKTEENGTNVNEHTIYEIGSITKTFTAILLAKQSLEVNLSLDEAINGYLPSDTQVPVMGETDITFAHLSDHTSGLPRLPGNMTPANPANPYADYTLDQMYAFISTYQPSREVGLDYEYSNLAQGLLGHLLALNQNTSYEELVLQDIAKPLKMKETKITLNEKMKERLALPHAGGQIVENWDIPTLAGAGAIRSSNYDMARFVSANLGYINTTLRPAMDLTHKERHSKKGFGVGLGWHIIEGSEGDIIWHNGGTGGYRSFCGFVKDSGKGVVVLTNSTESVDDIGFRLLDPKYNLKTIKSEDEAVMVSEEILESYVGVYELYPNFKITITRGGSQLYAQATGQQRFEVFAESDTSFYLTVVEAKITFQKNNDDVQSLTLFQGGAIVPGKKIK